MKVTVKLFATLKETVGSGEVEVDLPEGADVGDLLEMLSKDCGADLGNYVIDDGTRRVRQYLQIVVDGKYGSFSEQRRTKLSDGLVVTILPPIGGG